MFGSRPTTRRKHVNTAGIGALLFESCYTAHCAGLKRFKNTVFNMFLSFGSLVALHVTMQILEWFQFNTNLPVGSVDLTEVSLVDALPLLE